MPSVYESARTLHEYLAFHYGAPDDLCPWPFAPVEAFGFAERCVSEMLSFELVPAQGRALDVGCAVGRSSFELARHFQEVIGIDFSHRFIAAAQEVSRTGYAQFDLVEEGDRTISLRGILPSEIDRRRVQFQQGDALALPANLGTFDCVLAANLLCRLPDPEKFVRSLANLVCTGGQLIICTPCTWLEEFTPRAKWLCGAGSTREALKQLLERDFELRQETDLPFLIREHARKFQWSVSAGSLWVCR